MNFKPLYDRVVILPKSNEQETKYGIVLPDIAKERPQTGVVVAVGDGDNPDRDNSNEEQKMKVKVGDNVVYNKFAGVELEIDGKKHIVMRQIDIIGVIYD